MNIEEIKTRLSNLEAGKVIKYDNALNLATQYMLDYNNDVTYLLSIIEQNKRTFKDVLHIAKSDPEYALKCLEASSMKLE